MTLPCASWAVVWLMSSPPRRKNGFLSQWRASFPAVTLDIDVVEEKDRAETKSCTGFSVFVYLLRWAYTPLRGTVVLRVAGGTFAGGRKNADYISHCTIVLSAFTCPIFARGSFREKKRKHGLAHIVLLTWISGVAIFAREAVGGQTPGGTDPWLRSLDLSIPESHDRRVGVYDVLKGVENTPSDNLLFAVARDVLTTYELTKPFLEEVVRVHQQLRARHRENRKANAEDIQNGNMLNGGIVTQAVQTPVGKNRHKRLAIAGVTPAPAAGAGVSPTAAGNTSRSGTAGSAAIGVGPAAAPGEQTFAVGGGPESQQMQQQSTQHRQHGMRFPASIMHSRDAVAGKVFPADGGAWWNAKKTKRSNEGNIRKQGPSIYQETPGNRGPHVRRKYYREVSRGQLAEQGRTQQHPQHQLQHVSEPHPADNQQQFSTSSMQSFTETNG